MKETKIELSELGLLRLEILGSEDRTVNGVLSEELGIKHRYWIDKAIEKLSKESEILQKSINSLIEKYGEDVDGRGKSISPESKSYEEFLKEYNELSGQKVTVKLPKFRIDDLDFKSKNHYHLFFKYFIEEDE